MSPSSCFFLTAKPISMNYPVLMNPKLSATGTMEFDCRPRSNTYQLYNSVPQGKYINNGNLASGKSWYSLEYSVSGGWKQSGRMTSATDIYGGGPMYSNGALINGEQRWIGTCVEP